MDVSLPYLLQVLGELYVKNLLLEEQIRQLAEAKASDAD